MNEHNSKKNSSYKYSDHKLGDIHKFILPALIDIFEKRGVTKTAKLMDVGCGNGSVANFFSDRGWKVIGVDSSIEGIRHANLAYPKISINYGSVYDDLFMKFGAFPVVISLEVIEHLYDPRTFVKTIYDLAEPGGLCILSTPYHGYFKNIALALSGKLDQHFTALWDHGHIKFFSISTLTRILVEAGFEILEFRRVGRVPILARSMVVVARRPAK